MRLLNGLAGRVGAIAAAAMLCAASATVRGDAVGYDFTIQTVYQFGDPGNLVGGGSASPDTGFLFITNSGASTFTGDLSIFGLAGVGPAADVNFTKTGTFAPGQSFAFGAGDEGSNQGGFNGTQGIRFTINGTVTDGISETVNLTVFDQDIHSGVPRTNPFGLTLDNYILEGGDPTRDTQDAYETTQAPGNFAFVELRSVPEPGSVVLMGLGGLAICLLRRRRSAESTAG